MAASRSDPAAGEYDAIVVGSGISGGWAAKELTEKGLKTLLLEAGPPIVPSRDYVEHVQAYSLPYRGYGNLKKLHAEQPIQSQTGACNEWGAKFFVNDIENPYEYDAQAPFTWIRGRHVGGRSIMWGRQVYRWSDLDFEANAKEGIGVDWPIRYADIDPWYSHVEKFIGVSGQAEGLAQLPDGEFLPPMQLNCAETHVQAAMAKRFGRERVLTIGRCAILTRPHLGRAACHYCGPCERGCITASYFSSIGSTLPAAHRTGRLTLRPNTVVASVTYDERSARATGVRAVDAETMATLEFRARLVFLCASALESARILLNSKTPRFPQGLANSSGQLGRNVMDHCFGAGANGTLPGMEDHKTFGNRPNGIYVPRFRNVTGKHGKFVRGYGFQGAGFRRNWVRGAQTQGLGAEFKQALLRDLGPWRFDLGGFGECLPREENYVALHPTLKDKWGIPALRIQCTYGPNEREIIKDMQLSATEILEAAGAKDIETFNDELPPGMCIHEMGTARMGRDPKTSVLNAWNQAHDVPNLFVTDGACMSSSGNQNPSITYMALTARACDYAVEQLKRRDL
ncbi:MAG TPA: GMC family oxidoreductase [Steroidobacteraceae bacterium]|nr:GMC family oxidoreductase [Steroidobacteraceae bacterium]